ncbi:AAA protein, partial [Oryctes borbonicus]
MGKINTYRGIEVIPLDTNSNLSQSSVRAKHVLGGTPRMRKFAYPADPQLVKRVQRYLEDNVDQTYIDINAMAEEIQKTYKEYTKRKRSAFRAAIKKAYSVVMHSYGHNDLQHSSSDELSANSQGEEEDEEEYHNTLLNNHLEIAGLTDPNEAIDISSDDANDSDPNEKETSKQPSTSQEIVKVPRPVQVYVDPNSSTKGKKRKVEFESEVAAERKRNFKICNETFQNVGGMSKVFEEICKHVAHMKHTQVYQTHRVPPPRGFMLHGPPGCGKSLLCKAISGQLKIPLVRAVGTELVGGVSGETEKRIRKMFNIALAEAPCILFIDDIDTIASNREQSVKEHDKRMVTQLGSCLDELGSREKGDSVLVVGATNRLDAIDPALRRAGRFDREIYVGIPDIQARIEILQILTAHMQLRENFDFQLIAHGTPGYVGADLVAVTRSAAFYAAYRTYQERMQTEKEKRERERDLKRKKRREDREMDVEGKGVESDDDSGQIKEKVRRLDEGKPEEEVKVTDTPENIPTYSLDSPPVLVIDDSGNGDEDTHLPENLQQIVTWLLDDSQQTKEELETVQVTEGDFQKALTDVQPSLKREGFASIPEVTWGDVGSLGALKDVLKRSLLDPVKHAQAFKDMNCTMSSGILLWGPPGCGKTLVAKALANEAGLNFLSVKGPELLNMYVGESERSIRVYFERARNVAPCVIFFDELDALCPKRSESGDGGASMRVVNQMLTELDGAQERHGVFILAATNRPDILDPAVLRTGRFDKIFYVGIPSSEDRVDILKALTKNGTRPRLAPDVNLEELGRCSSYVGYTGADLAGLVREACALAFGEYILRANPQEVNVITNDHFTTASRTVRASVSESDRRVYQRLRSIYDKDYREEEMDYTIV